MRKLRHSKYKNTGFLYEMIVRQITADIIGGRESLAEGILSKYFGKGTELGKELQMYHLILSKRVISEIKAERILDAVLGARKRLSERRLGLEKFELIKEIKNTYDIDKFFRSQVTSYKVLASIYKLFENATSTKLYRPKDVFVSKTTIIESIISDSSAKVTKIDPLMEAFSKEDADTRKLSQYVFLKKFNDKYKSFDSRQKKLLREYINNVSNTNSLSEYIKSEVPKIQLVLKAISKRIDDSVTIIKLEETIKQLQTASHGRIVKDNHVTAVMMAYELIKELEHVAKGK